MKAETTDRQATSCSISKYMTTAVTQQQRGLKTNTSGKQFDQDILHTERQV